MNKRWTERPTDQINGNPVGGGTAPSSSFFGLAEAATYLYLRVEKLRFMISSQAYIFETPLTEGVVIKRNSQFTMTI